MELESIRELPTQCLHALNMYFQGHFFFFHFVECYFTQREKYFAFLLVSYSFIHRYFCLSLWPLPGKKNPVGEFYCIQYS